MKKAGQKHKTHWFVAKNSFTNYIVIPVNSLYRLKIQSLAHSQETDYFCFEKYSEQYICNIKSTDSQNYILILRYRIQRKNKLHFDIIMSDLQ